MCRRRVEVEALLDDGDEDVDGDRDPDLSLHRILRGAIKPLDAKVLLDPLEEQLNLPARLVERADGGCRQSKLVAQEHQRLGAFGIPQPDATQMIGIMLLAIVPIEGDGRVADDPGGATVRRRVDATGIEIGLRAGREEGAGLMQHVEPLEVEIAAVHHVNGTGFGEQQVEDIDIVQPSVGDVNEARDGTAQIEYSTYLDCGLAGTYRRPR